MRLRQLRFGHQAAVQSQQRGQQPPLLIEGNADNRGELEAVDDLHRQHGPILREHRLNVPGNRRPPI